MNSINLFSTKKKFPLSTQAIDFMQNMVKVAYKLARIGGSDNYILDGCQNTTGSTWLSGYVVINGELLPFMGGTGTLESSVRIKETKTDAVAGYDTYEGSYTTRYVEFGSNIGNVDTFAWNTFGRLKTNAEIVRDFATKAELDAVRLLVMPRGAVIEYDIVNNPLPLPVGWTFCGGSNVVGYGVVPNKKGRVSVGFDPDAVNSPTIIVDQRNTDNSVIENYGAVGNTGGKPGYKLKAAESGLPAHDISIQLWDFDSYSQADVIASGRDDLGNEHKNGTIAISVAAQDAANHHENRMPYVVSYFIVKTV